MKHKQRGKVSGSAAAKARTVVQAKAAAAPSPPSREVDAKAAATATRTTTTTVKYKYRKPKTLYIYVWHIGGSIVGSLYAIGIPNPLLLKPTNPSNTAIGPPKNISPILTFSSKKYPKRMGCVKYDSKLYFLGGEFYNDADRSKFFLPDVYIFDTTTNGGASGLEKGTKMKTGKRDPLAFVFERKIYVLSSLESYDKTQDLSRFECFDPESDEWTVLDDPPTTRCLTAYAVVRSKVFVLGRNHDLYCYDFCTSKWNSPRSLCGLSCLRSVCEDFYPRAEFADDTLYAENNYGRVIAYGPFSESTGESEDQVFDRFTFISPNAHIHHHLLGLEPSSCLTHLGDRRFCRMVITSPPDPEFPHLSHPKRCNISILIFQALKDTCQIGDGRKTFFRAEFLHSVHFVSRSSSASTGIFIDGGFYVPWHII